MFFPLQNACETISPLDVAPLTTSFYAIRSRTQITPGTDKVGTVYAISVETGKTVWKYEQRAGMMSLVATGGGLVFGGDTNGHFRALDQDSGKVLWEVNVGSPVTGYPIAYAVSGKQFIAVSTGKLAGELRPHDIDAGAASEQLERRFCILAAR